MRKEGRYYCDVCGKEKEKSDLFLKASFIGRDFKAEKENKNAKGHIMTIYYKKDICKNCARNNATHLRVSRQEDEDEE